jgi:uncharacterized protein DUF4123
MVKSLSRPNRIRYLVLESQSGTPLLQELYGITGSPQWLYLFADTEWHTYLKEGPILLESRQDSEEYRWALQRIRQERLSGLILESSGGLDAVSNWLRERLNVRFEGRRTGLLRFYDPKIWHRLKPRSNPREELIERAIYWHGVLGQERWLAGENPEPIAMSPTPTLDEQQWLALNASSI